MKKFLLTVVLAFAAIYVFAQERIAVFPFEILDNAVTRNESFQLYREFSNVFRNRSPNSSTVVPRQDVDRLITAEMEFQLTVFSAQEKTAELMRVQNATQIISGTIGKMENSITIIVSLYTYPELDQLPGGDSLRANSVVELFDRMSELVQNMLNIIAESNTGQYIPAGLQYEIIDGEIIAITGYTGNATALNIPGRIAGLPVTSIEYAFSECSSLTRVSIPSSVTDIYGAFDGCSSLTSITVDTRNPDYASVDGVLFDKNIETLIRYPEGRNQRTYVIPSSVTEIGYRAFAGCSILTSLTIPSSVTSIGNYNELFDEFYDDDFYGEFYDEFYDDFYDEFYDEFYSGFYNVFEGCSSLTSINVDNRNTVYASVDGVLFDKDIQTLIRYPQGKNQRTYVIPSSVTGIVNWAFADCRSLTRITIPSSVTFIGESVFEGCSSLTSVTIPSSVTAILFCTFAECSSLTNVTIPSSVTFIGGYAFLNCNSLTSINIPSSVTQIGDYGGFWFEFYEAFEGCSSLTSITVDARNFEYSSVDGVLFDKNKETLIRYPQGKNQRTYVIPSSVTSIDHYAFSGCGNLTSVTIPSSVTAIGYCAFYDCNSLTSVTIPSSVTAILFSTFSGCSSLTSVTIPSSVTEIGYGAFYGCNRLTGVNIPSSVRSIESEAFAECTRLTSVTLSRRTRVEEGAFPSSARIAYRD